MRDTGGGEGRRGGSHHSSDYSKCSQLPALEISKPHSSPAGLWTLWFHPTLKSPSPVRASCSPSIAHGLSGLLSFCQNPFLSLIWCSSFACINLPCPDTSAELLCTPASLHAPVSILMAQAVGQPHWGCGGGGSGWECGPGVNWTVPIPAWLFTAAMTVGK